MSNLDYLIKLVSEATEGKDNFKEGAVGSNGYGFIFRNYDYASKNSFIINYGSCGLCFIGIFRSVHKKFKRNMERMRDLDYLLSLLNYDPKLDLHFGGALKTLIPEIKFGGYEILFDVWVFVKSPKDQLFPVTFYYKNFGPSIGAWDSDYQIYTGKKVFPKEFESIINFSPFNFSNTELEEFIEAFESAINKVPISDFQAKYRNELGNHLVGIRDGKPFIENLEIDDLDVETWSYCIMGNTKAERLRYEFIELENEYLTSEEDKLYPDEIPYSMHKILIERAYDKLVAHAYSKKSRLAFMVLGVFLMLNQGKMTEDLKQVILKYSDWKYEKDQLKNKTDRSNRKKYLADFRKKIKNYDETERLVVPYVSRTRREGFIDIKKQNINYSIKD